ncbi:MAG: M24 family metallopeptidase [Anaerolineae bacterium]
MTQIVADEYKDRLQRIRQAMGEQELDALLVYSWKRGQVRYVSGYHPNYVANVAMVVVPLQGKPTLLIRFPFDLGRAQQMSWMDDVRASGDWAGFVRDCKAALAKHNAVHGRVGLVSGDFVVNEMPYTLYQHLVDALPQVELIPALPIFEKARLLKSPAECALMEDSARIADAAVAAAAEALTPGRTEYEVTAAAEGAARALGAEDCLAVIAPGSLELVGPPEDRTIEPEEMVVFEFAAQVKGYWTQVARVFHAGAPTAEQREMYDVAYRSYMAGVKAARLGNTVGDVARDELAVLEEAGWLEWREYDLGHGDGLDHPEVPAITPASEMVIEAGMVLCIHPGLRKPGVGGAFVGGTVLVGEEEMIPLHRIPATL